MRWCTVFSLYELYSRLDIELEQGPIPMRVFEFTPDDFGNRSSEESIVVFRSEKTDCADLLRFYLQCLKRIYADLDYPARDAVYEDPPQFAEIGREEADPCLRYRRLAHRPVPPMFDSQRFVRAWCAEPRWDDVQTLIEFEEAYVGFFWSTSA